NVTLTLTGTLERPTIDLASEDGSLTPGQIAAGIVGQTNTETALTLLSADLLGVTGRAIGLDAFRVERGDFTDRDFRDYVDDPTLIGDQTDPTTRLTVGKRLSDQVEFTVSQNLRENGKATFVISYFPRRNIELRALSRDRGTVSLGVRHQITFGNGTSTPPSERRVRPLVTAITVSGVAPPMAAAVRELINLEVEDEFDFLELQNDIDAIREDFHEQGYLEARIRTRRTESDDARGVAIEFIVDHGPKTLLQFDGFVPPSDLVEELEEAWHKNVFDQFLIDDLTHRVRRHLVTSGDLGNIVVGRIDRPNADTKRLRIEVTPGAPVTAREIRFAGNLELDAERLDAEIVAAGVDLEAWLDRTVAERAIRQAYQEEGFLKAEVIARPLIIEGSVGVLLIDIKEGPRASITDIRWAGIGEARLPEIQKAAELAAPTPYVIANVTDARRRIEDYYRQQGFNSAVVEAQPVVAPDDTVVVSFTVTEGPQQVLQSVELKGNDVTNEKVLRQALKFEFGKPVDLDQWAVARKRLYDTNVFRVVDLQPVPVAEPENGVQPVKAVVTVEEIPAWSFRYGFQLEGERRSELDEFTSTRNAGVVAELRNPNLFGRALTGGVFGMYQRDFQDATLFVGTSRLFGWSARSTLYGFYSHDRLRDDLGDVTAVTDREGVSVDQRWRPRGFQIVYGYRFERNTTIDPRTLKDPIPFQVTVNLAKLNSAILYDRRDDPISARKGFFSSVSFDQAALFLGSDVNNRKLLTQHFVFVPLGRLVLASRAQFGFAFGRDRLAFTDRFRAGGATSVRGYGEESLGPRDREGVPSGGDRLVILNQEARFPMYRWANGVVFVDAGNIFEKGAEWTGLKVGYGVGLRFDTPVGLIRGDVGFPRNDVAQSRRTARWYFGFGHIF
ncbi:MAG TPA: translocation/assembly module TamB domain-containing protein, partial [Vicinamibacterales bacterium]|nr:translocation/assembly module TamB domain-containing protein [Vicinamibacterales bacterium]